jgi:hypothetical protein
MSDAARVFARAKVAVGTRPGMLTPCLEWAAARDKDGYGRCKWKGKMARAHRVAWAITHGGIPDGLYVLHRCDNPSCVALDHLWLGTNRDNISDRDAKGRQASGDRNGSRLYPEKLARGDRNGARLHPESMSRGDSHWTRLHPERVARGDNSFARLYPERMSRGNANGSRLHPESRPRGERHANAKLTEESVRAVFKMRAQGWICKRIGDALGVSDVLIGLILARKAWAHVDVDGLVTT